MYLFWFGFYIYWFIGYLLVGLLSSPNVENNRLVHVTTNQFNVAL